MRLVSTAIADRTRHPGADPSLFDLIGGRVQIARLVERFQRRLVDDEELAQQLAPLGPAALDEGLTAFLTRALGGSATDDAAGLASADPLSVWLDVEPFTRVVAHLWMTLLELELSTDLKDQVVVAIILGAMTPAAG